MSMSRTLTAFNVTYERGRISACRFSHPQSDVCDPELQNGLCDVGHCYFSGREKRYGRKIVWVRRL